MMNPNLENMMQRCLRVFRALHPDIIDIDAKLTLSVRQLKNEATGETTVEFEARATDSGPRTKASTAEEALATLGRTLAEQFDERKTQLARELAELVKAIEP